MFKLEDSPSHSLKKKVQEKKIENCHEDISKTQALIFSKHFVFLFFY
jgi:Protein tyrosine and serine/threonine kinase